MPCPRSLHTLTPSPSIHSLTLAQLTPLHVYNTSLLYHSIHTHPHTLTEVSTRMVSEYKTKLQISEAERSRLEGMVCVCVCVCVTERNGVCVCVCDTQKCTSLLHVPCTRTQTNRLTGQVTRYKNQVKELEEREDELMKEKRKQAKEVSQLIWCSPHL